MRGGLLSVPLSLSGRVRWRPRGPRDRRPELRPATATGAADRGADPDAGRQTTGRGRRGRPERTRVDARPERGNAGSAARAGTGVAAASVHPLDGERPRPDHGPAAVPAARLPAAPVPAAPVPAAWISAPVPAGIRWHAPAVPRRRTRPRHRDRRGLRDRRRHHQKHLLAPWSQGSGVRPEGEITRGTTNPSRLRRVDRWITRAQHAVLRAGERPLIVDLGFGASPVTTVELYRRVLAVAPDAEVIGLEIDQERVAAA